MIIEHVKLFIQYLDFLKFGLYMSRDVFFTSVGTNDVWICYLSVEACDFGDGD